MTQRAIVTGAGGGIGAVIARRLTDDGFDVVKLDISGSNYTHCDVTDENAIRSLVDEIGPVDVLVNNAALGESGSLAEVDIERVRRIFEVNLFSTLALTQVALRGMIARQRGTVVFISSIAGRVPFPFLMPYSMTKFALSAAAAGLRAEMDQLGKGIAVCVVEPGAIHTGFNQSMAASKYAWMGPDSYFHDQKEKMQAEEKRTFSFLEAKTTDSVVAAIVKASEAKRPRLRYVAPWIQGFGVRMARIFGV